MTTSRRQSFPVTVTRLPVVRCQVCTRTVAHRPGEASTALTEHYRRLHPALVDGSRDSRPAADSPPSPGRAR